MSDLLTTKVGLELVGHEAIVREWYLDSVGMGTWGVGVTNRSGHNVDRYKNNPQPIEKCLEIYVWLLRHRYAPDVLDAFRGYELTEAKFAAALSFHYNTGAIHTSSWVSMVKSGKAAGARAFLESHYLNDGTLTERRKKEGRLFFEGVWSQDGKATVYPVLKPSYHPDFHHPQRVDISTDMAQAIAMVQA